MAVRFSMEESGSLYGSIQPYSPWTTSSSSNSRSIRRSWQRWRASRNGRERDSTGMRSPTINVADKSESSESSDSSSEEESQASTKRFPSGPKLPSCHQMCSQRIPKGRALVLILLLLIADKYVLYGAIDQVLGLIPELPSSVQNVGFGSFLRILLYYCIGRLFYPVGGFLADVFLGRYRVIHISLWLYWIAFALLAVSYVLRSLKDATQLYTYVFPISAYILVILAAGGFESTLIPFGADQLEAAGSNELSSYFYWYYAAIQIGLFGNVLVTSLITLWVPAYISTIVHVLVTFVVASSALILHSSLEHWFFKNALRENCIKMVLKVLWFAATVKRHLPQYRRAFRYGEGRLPRIELAKQQYDGKFTGDQVEDVKTFCRICLVLFTLGGYFFSLGGGNAILTYRLNATLLETNNASAMHPFASSAFTVLNTLPALLFVPLINHIFVPCLPSMTMKQRMGIGMIIHILALGSGAILEWMIATKDVPPLQQALWFILPSVLLTLPELFVYVTALEFVYAQSPESMKGMLTGLYYFIIGLFGAGSTFSFYFFIKSTTSFEYYYLILLVFAVLGFVSYVIVACMYENRQRPTQENEEGDDIQHAYNIVIPKT